MTPTPPSCRPSSPTRRTRSSSRCTAARARTARSARSWNCSTSRTWAPAPTPAGSPSTSPPPRPSYARSACARPTRSTLPKETFHDLGATAVLGRIVERLGLPLFVKPARGGSALGASIVRTAEELPAAMVGCFAYGDTALIERYIEGIEVAVSVVDLGDGPGRPARRGDRARRGRVRLRRPLHGRAHRVLRPGPPLRRSGRGLRRDGRHRSHRARACATSPAPTSSSDACGPAALPRGQRGPRDDRDVAAAHGRRGGRAGPGRALPHPPRDRRRPRPARNSTVPPVCGPTRWAHMSGHACWGHAAAPRSWATHRGPHLHLYAAVAFPRSRGVPTRLPQTVPRPVARAVPRTGGAYRRAMARQQRPPWRSRRPGGSRPPSPLHIRRTVSPESNLGRSDRFDLSQELRQRQSRRRPPGHTRSPWR